MSLQSSLCLLLLFLSWFLMDYCCFSEDTSPLPQFSFPLPRQQALPCTLMPSPFTDPSLKLAFAKLHVSSSHWCTGMHWCTDPFCQLPLPSSTSLRSSVQGRPGTEYILGDHHIPMGSQHRQELDQLSFSNVFSFSLELQAAVKKKR